jgi:hypothetical protein
LNLQAIIIGQRIESPFLVTDMLIEQLFTAVPLGFSSSSTVGKINMFSRKAQHHRL